MPQNQNNPLTKNPEILLYFIVNICEIKVNTVSPVSAIKYKRKEVTTVAIIVPKIAYIRILPKFLKNSSFFNNFK